MKRLTILVLFIMVSGCASFPPGSPQAEKVVEIQTMVDNVKAALAIVDQQLGKKDSVIKLTKAELTVKTVVEDKKKGEVKLWVVSGDLSRRNQSTDQIVITLVPSTTKESIQVSEKMKKLSKRLADSIIVAVEGVSEAGVGSYPLELVKLEVQIGLLVEKVGQGGLGYDIEVIPVGVGGKMSYSKGDMNTLKLEFVDSKP